MKKALVIVCAALLLFSLSGCGAGGLVVWSFTDEVEGLIKNYYLKDNPKFKLKYVYTPTDQFEGRLDPVLSVGKGVPDVFALEAAFVRKYVEGGQLLDLTDIYERNKSKLLAYPVEIGTFEGRVYAMSWQACPGAMFYRRSLAKKYLGNDDPTFVQTYFSDLNKFMETAELLKQKSNGQCVVVSSRGDLYNVFLGARKNPWVVNGRLEIDPATEQYMELSKTIHENRYDARVGQWSGGWFEAMRDELKDANGRQYEAFANFLPTWGLHYVLKTNTTSEDGSYTTAGDWAMIPGPAPYRWGGTWLGAWKDTQKAEEAKQLIEYIATDDAFLEKYAKDSGDMVGNLNVVNKIKDDFSEPFLGGQNHYAAFAEMAKTVDGKLVQGTDQSIESIFSDQVTAYVEGEKTKAQALADFRQQASIQLGL
jgi:ABC-type glycerol-3-phosphate transport system substrate-binding protein